VQFYDDDGFLATVVNEFLAGGLRDDQPVIVVATPAHAESFLTRLRADGIDVVAARRNRRLTVLDARDLLSQFMNRQLPDPQRFRAVVGRVIEQCLAGREKTQIRAYGEMVDVLWKDGNIEGAIRLEDLWNELARTYDFSLLCAYSMGNFCRASDADHFRQLCSQHTHVSPAETFTQADDAARLVEISVLQQRSRALEAEIVQRELLEQRLRDALVAVQEREEDLRDVLENAAEGIHLVSPDGIILWANDAELTMLGYTASEYIGGHIADFHADAPVVEDMLARLTRGETLRGYEARVRCKDGSIRHVLVNSNVRWRDGKFVHTRCFSSDITHLREADADRERLLELERAARAEADKARAVAEQANRAKSEFLAVMSHELRTPLNAIGGYAELMELGIHGSVTEEQREALERIQRSQRMLLGLINQVLNYARIETGNVRYDVADLSVGEILRTMEALILPQLRAKGLRYVYAGCDATLVVRADGEKLQQILLNLLTNAIKFTDRGGEIRLDVEAGEQILVKVHDTGIGISNEKLGAIFEPFVQVDAKYTRTGDGVGLGLAISRDLARGMGGDIVVESIEGQGSTFTVFIERGMVAP
jgi:PAS domain S-box-containing protein